MDLKELVDALAAMPEADREQAVADALDATKHLAWVPNPGPQTQAYFSEADEVFYGGSAGCGKTALEIGLALTAHKRSLILRRTNREAQGLAEQLAEMLGTRDGFNSQTGTWRLKDRTIDLGGMQLEEDRQKYKGIPHDLICVGRGTPVLMADGTFTPVEDVQSGDAVATLEGPRFVKRAFKVTNKPAVRVRVALPTGEWVEQVQSAEHRLLTPRGWQALSTAAAPCAEHPPTTVCYETPECFGVATHQPLEPLQPAPWCTWSRPPKAALTTAISGRLRPTLSTLLAGHSPRLYGLHSASKLCRVLRKFCESVPPRCLAALRLFSLKPPGQQLAVGLAQAIFGRLHQSVIGVSYPPPAEGTYGAESYASCLNAPPPLVSSGLSAPPARPLPSLAPVVRQRLSARDAADALAASSPVGFRADYLKDYGLSGVLLPPRSLVSTVLTDDQALFQLRDGVAQPTPKSSSMGGGARTPTHTSHKHTYPHPYGKGTRLTAAGLFDAYAEAFPVNVDELFDLEVEDVNHFITRGGLVNKNCFDELSDFSESQYVFVLAWNRSADPGQRCRALSAGNPPTRPEGLWVVKRWAAWLDPTHHNPAQPGELRWYTNVNGEDTEVDGYGPHLINGEEVFARSRTFIPGKLSDNPDLAATDYKASLDSLPEELRAAYRDGDFGTGLRDDPYQTIPTEWIRAAQARWTSNPPVGVPLCAMGVDVAQGGADDTALALRRDGWYDKIITVPGKLTPDGKAVSGYVVANRRDGAKVIIDLGGGWGGDAFGHLRENGVDTVGYMGVKPSPRRSVCSRYAFFNIRAQAYWQFREALDPSQEQGSTICLPPDAELVADLCAPTYQIVRPNVIKIEAKEDLVKRLGRSPNRGDAVVMAWFDGDKISNQAGGVWKGRKTAPRVVLGRGAANTKR